MGMNAELSTYATDPAEQTSQLTLDDQLKALLLTPKQRASLTMLLAEVGKRNDGARVTTPELVGRKVVVLLNGARIAIGPSGGYVALDVRTYPKADVHTIAHADLLLARQNARDATRAARSATTAAKVKQPTGHINVIIPALGQLRSAHEEYVRTVPNNYAAVIVRIADALAQRDLAGAADAVAEWLRSVNEPYHSVFNRGNASREVIEPLITVELNSLLDFRTRSIAELNDEDENTLRRVFAIFRRTLGPVGAAKSLHVLAPYFLAMWDTDIANFGYGLSTEDYLQLMFAAKQQVLNLPREIGPGTTALKALDEYNYLRYTLGREI